MRKSLRHCQGDLGSESPPKPFVPAICFLFTLEPHLAKLGFAVFQVLPGIRGINLDLVERYTASNDNANSPPLDVGIVRGGEQLMSCRKGGWLQVCLYLSFDGIIEMATTVYNIRPKVVARHGKVA